MLGAWFLNTKVFFIEIISEFQSKRIRDMGAALAFYSSLSLAPLCVILVTVIGLVYGKAAAKGLIVETTQGWIGADSAAVIERMIQSASQPFSGLLASLISIGVLILGASGVYLQLQDTLNLIFEAKPRESRPFVQIIKRRALAFSLVLFTGSFLMISVLLSSIVAGMTRYLSQKLMWIGIVLQYTDLAVSIFLTTSFFALLFKLLPEKAIAWRPVLLGALVSALLFTFGKSLIAAYIGHTSVGSVFGAAGSLVALLLWIYYTAQIIFLGAVSAHCWAKGFNRIAK